MQQWHFATTIWRTTYAYLKIAQRLDDMMQTAGLKVTRTGGLDVAGELRNTAMNTVAAYNSFRDVKIQHF